MAGTLETLLVRIREGSGSESDLVQARGLVQHDARLPPELRRGVLVDVSEASSDAAGLLAVLGADDLFGEVLEWGLSSEASPPEEALVEVEDDWVWGPQVVEAISAEAGVVDIVDGVLARVDRGVSDWVYGPLLIESLRQEAGQINVVSAVVAAIGERSAPVADAVRAELSSALDVEMTTLLALVADAVREEAGAVDVSGSVLTKLGLAAPLSISSALRQEAGSVDVTGTVAASLGVKHIPVSEAIVAEAGRIDIASSVLAELGESVLSVAEAVQSESGTVDISADWSQAPVADAVRAEAGIIDVWAGVRAGLGQEGASQQGGSGAIPTPIAASLNIPTPANDLWAWRAVLMAAVVLFVLGAGQLLGSSPTIGPAQPAPMQFASASEIVVDELEWSDTVQVMQTEGDEGALIIWVDEEAT